MPQLHDCVIYDTRPDAVKALQKDGAAATLPAPVPSVALYAHFSSRNGGSFANRVPSAMRKEFGGRAVGRVEQK